MYPAEKSLEPVTAGPPVPHKHWWDVTWDVSVDTTEMGFSARRWVCIEVRAYIVRDKNGFPKFKSGVAPTLTYDVSKLLDSAQSVLEVYQNPEYRGWVQFVSGYIRPKVADYRIAFYFGCQFEDGDIPDGWLEFTMFLTLRSMIPSVNVMVAPGEEDWCFGSTFLGRLFRQDVWRVR